MFCSIFFLGFCMFFFWYFWGGFLATHGASPLGVLSFLVLGANDTFLDRIPQKTRT